MSENGFECLSAHFKLNIYCVIRLFCFNLKKKKKKEREVSIRLFKCDGNMWLESKTLLQSWCGRLAFTKSPSISFFPWAHHCEKSALLVSKPGRAGEGYCSCVHGGEGKVFSPTSPHLAGLLSAVSPAGLSSLRSR